MRRLCTALVSVVLALTLAGCGGSDTSTNPKADQSAPTAPVSGEHNAADVMFAQMMIQHHSQAIDMAKMATGRAANPQVLALANQIQAAQGPEISTMTGWLAGWGEPTSMPGGGGHSMSSHGTTGMMSDDDMAKLEALSGREFDREFLVMMTEHHRGAVEMARTERADGRYPAAHRLAAEIITSQTAEIARMAALLRRV